jgi:hypothetical protein
MTASPRTIALTARARGSAGMDELSSALAGWARVAPVSDGGRPDACIVTAGDVDDVTARFTGVPVAVVIEPGSDTPAHAGAHAFVFTLPRPAIDARAHPPVSPAVRARFRRMLAIPDDLVVVIGFDPATPLSERAVPSALALARAAAVRGPNLLLALALGTPTVTDAGSARTLDAVDGRDVVVAEPGDVVRTARELGDDMRRAARVGWSARRLVERSHDVGPLAREIARRTGLLPDTTPVANVVERLQELGTPDGSPVTAGALAACEPFLTISSRAGTSR